MTNITDSQKQELVDYLVTLSCEDTAFLNNRLYELVDLAGDELWNRYELDA